MGSSDYVFKTKYLVLLIVGALVTFFLLMDGGAGNPGLWRISVRSFLGNSNPNLGHFSLVYLSQSSTIDAKDPSRRIVSFPKVVNTTIQKYRYLQKDVVTVLMWDKMFSIGALKLINLEKECEENHQRHPERTTKCPAIMIPNCPVPCRWSTSRALLPSANVVIVHPDESLRFPDKKYQRQLWAVFGHEPTWKRPWFWVNDTAMDPVDLSFHWGEHADVQLRFYYFDEIYFSTDPGAWWKKFDADTHWRPRIRDGAALAAGLEAGVKLTYVKDGTIYPDDVVEKALISVVVSSCTPSRMLWLRKFIKSFPTASYGGCLKNAMGDEKHILDEKDLMAQKVKLIGRHPFHLAIESDMEAGFVTEKVFQSLWAGVIPVYVGNREVLNMVPNNSVIYALDFPDLQGLVDHLTDVVGNETKYMEYHAWRKDPSTQLVFNRLKAEGRTTAACRLCEYYKYNRNNPELYQTMPQWDPHSGWSRVSRPLPTLPN